MVLHDDLTVSPGCDINRVVVPMAAMVVGAMAIRYRLLSSIRRVTINEEWAWNSDDTEMPNPSRSGIWWFVT
jgi:hypothetical protein